MLDSAIKEQLKGLFAQLDAHYTFDIFVHPRHESRAELVDLLEEVASCSEKLSCRLQESEGLKFILLKEGEDTGITFRAVPGGHEFTSLLMAILNADGKGKNFPDEFITRRIRALRGPINLTTYLSLGCTNCPDVVQALNLMVVLNPQIRHEAVDGAVNEEEVNRMKVQAVPTVFADGEQIHVGRGNIGDLLEKLEVRYGASVSESFETKEYDVLVAGGGPAGAAAAIYSARKGLRVAVVAERIGGQVNETMGIENLISVPRTTGKELAQDLKSHLAAYHIDILENRRIEKAEVVGEMKVLSVKGGESYKIVPGMLMAAARLNIPSILVSGGPMLAGHFGGEEVSLSKTFEAVGAYKAGMMDEETFYEAECNSCPGCGSCAGMYTANSMNCLSEAIGMALPGNGTTPAVSAARIHLAKHAGMKIMELIEKGIKPRDILTPAAFRNALTCEMAIGCSTNSVLHLLAIANEAGVPLQLETLNELSGKVPNICHLAPAGPHHIEQLYMAGGVPAIMKELTKRDFLDLSLITCTGKTVSENLEGVVNKNPEVIRTIDNPYSKTGGIAVLRGNLAPDSCVVKRSAVAPEMLVHEGPARIFESDEEATEAIKSGKINPGDVIVIRYEGPKGGPGMREMLNPTSAIAGYYQTGY
mgnify:CR=1 FL=1